MVLPIPLHHLSVTAVYVNAGIHWAIFDTCRRIVLKTTWLTTAVIAWLHAWCRATRRTTI